MAQRESPFGDYRGISQARITGNVAVIANTHENNRQNEIKKVLLHLFLMAKFKLIPLGSTIGFRSAQVQYLTGTSGDNAAHCLPCQILVGTQTPQAILDGLSSDLFIEVAQAFGATDLIPQNFNKADSLAETKGLKEAFRRASEQVVSLGHTLRVGRADQFGIHIATIFGSYRAAGMLAYRGGINHLQPQILAATGAKRDERQQRSDILGHYLQHLQTASTSLETVMFLNGDDLQRSYREIAPNP